MPSIFLGLPELVFELFTLGQIEHEAHALVRVVLKNRRAGQDGHTRAVLADEFFFKRRADAGGGHFLQGAFVEFCKFRRRHRQPVDQPRFQIVSGIAHEFQKGGHWRR